ncbi:MAG: nuclear transport factor 2 family protein [Actinomycetota bacterium]
MGLTPIEVVERYLASFTTGDPDRIASLVTADFENRHHSALGGGCTGRAAYRERLPGFLADLPELRYESQGPIAEGFRVAAPYRLTARPGGVDVEVHGVMIVQVRGELVAARTDYWDSHTFLRQIGEID